MGCDIHAYIEYDDFKTQTGEWFVSDFAHPSVGRNYTMFALMAGVRYDPRTDTDFKPLFAARGLPKSISWSTEREYTCVVSDEHAAKGWERYCTTEEAHRWLDHGHSKWYNEGRKIISGPDWHHASWLTVDELEQCIRAFEAVKFPNESWFQSRPPEQQRVPEGATVQEFQSRWGKEWYVSVGELKTYPAPHEYVAILAAMKVLQGDGKDGRQARLVFWFDN